MPISGVDTWLPTIDEFLAHWAAVNAALAPGALTLSGGYAISGIPSLTGDRATLDTAIEAVQDQLNLLSNARGTRDILRVALNPRFVQFRAMVNGLLPTSQYIESIPASPTLNSSQGEWTEAIDDMDHLWGVINTNVPPVAGFTPPLLLAAAYARATFTTDSDALKTSFTTVTQRAQDSQQSREHRDAVFAPVYERMRQYRQVVQGTFGPEHELIESLPDLTPLAGHTPDPVSLSGIWDPSVTAARLTYYGLAGRGFAGI